MTATQTVKGSDLASLAGQDRAVRIGSRWYWIQSAKPYDAMTGRPFADSGLGFVVTVPHKCDPRHTNPRSAKWRAIYSGETYPVRAEKAPEWEWVTRRLARDNPAPEGTSRS